VDNTVDLVKNGLVRDSLNH